MENPLRKNDIKILSAIEHCLKRPSMYCGSTNIETSNVYIYENSKIIQKELPFIPALLKIFSEIVDNSLDEAIRTNFKYGNKIKINFNEKTGEVDIEDNGRGLPIEYNEDLKKWTPEIIYTTLNAGSNFNDEDIDKAATIGMNGVGASLTAIYSKKFLIETANGLKYYKQEFENHLSIKRKPLIKDDNRNFTYVKYLPNYDYFKITEEVSFYLNTLYYKRIKDLSFAYPEITFYYNGEKLNASNLKTFLKQIHEIYECNETENSRIGLFYSDTEFQHISFVNGSDTKRGGTHVEYCTNKIVEYIKTFLKKKHKLEVKPIDIKSKLFLLLAIRSKNIQFDSQTKERLLSNNVKEQLDEILTKKFLDSILKNDEIILPIIESYKLQLQVKENLKIKELNKNKKRLKIDNYLPAYENKEYLFLTEGQSAQGSLSAVLGRQNYSFFALKGKPLNTLEIPLSKILENDEFKNIINILNLQLNSEKSDINYNSICIATDSDLDGSHIRSLMLCFFNRFAKSLLQNGKIKFLKTPIIGAKRNNKLEKWFFTLQEYKSFLQTNTIKFDWVYYKGLGTWTNEDLSNVIKKEGIENLIETFICDENFENSINNWMSKNGIDTRKENISKMSFDINSI